jgi:hypothetical protein
MTAAQIPKPPPADDSGIEIALGGRETAGKPTDCRFFYTLSGAFQVEQAPMPARNSHGGRALPQPTGLSRGLAHPLAKTKGEIERMYQRAWRSLS